MAPRDVSFHTPARVVPEVVRQLIASAEAEEQLLVALAEAVRRKDADLTCVLAARLVAIAVPERHNE